MVRKPVRAMAFTIVCLLGMLCLGPAASADGSYGSPVTHNPNHNIRAIADSKYYQIVIDKEEQLLTVLRKDQDGKYTIIDRQMVCSTNRPGKNTPLGTFKISTKRPWLYSSGYYVWIQYACRINGKIWIHSSSYSKRKDPNTLVKESYLDLGKPASAGCIRLCVRDAKWIYTYCPGGTVVKVVKSGGPAPIYVMPLPELPEGATYDPTDIAATP